jgi:SAM-dependent methyltransferase
LNKLQHLIYNEGERLVPYVSHNENELARHRSSYAFFHSVITNDLACYPLTNTPISVADLGFGSGYGCALLSSLPNSLITGVDISEECEIFARQYYGRLNVNYLIKDLTKFIPKAEVFDYVVSRGVLEHIPDGINLIKHIKFQRRVMIDVPYDEKTGNEHHVLTGIKEDAFSELKDCEFFYEDRNGRIFDSSNKPTKSNMIMVVISAPDLSKVSSLFQFPIEPICDTELEIRSGIHIMDTYQPLDVVRSIIGDTNGLLRQGN